MGEKSFDRDNDYDCDYDCDGEDRFEAVGFGSGPGRVGFEMAISATREELILSMGHLPLAY